MAKPLRWLSRLGRLIGFVLVVGAAAAVFLLKFERKVEEAPQPVRPLKSIVLGGSTAPRSRSYPGKVRAARVVDLAFEQSGSIIELPGQRGDSVAEGDLLARLDSRDFQNDLDAAQAALDRSKAHLSRIEQAAKSNAVSEQEVTDAQARVTAAQAEVNIRQKAVDDTSLRAAFDGMIAERFVENFQRVHAKEPIVSLQDVSAVEVIINVPEEQVAQSQRREDRPRTVALFDYLPGREFPVELREFSTDADPNTQTFEVRYTMVQPEDLNILAGMTATVVISVPPDPKAQTAEVAVPLNATVIDGTGNYSVWVMKDSGEGVYTVARREIEVGDMAGDEVRVLGGLEMGERIAAAGVNQLVEGQRVRLLEPKQKGGEQ